MARTNWLSTLDSCVNTPPVDVEAPAGRLTPASLRLTSFWTAVVLLPVIVPVMDAVRSPLSRLTVRGPATCCSVASGDSGCGPLAVGTCMDARPLGVAVPGGSYALT